MKMKSNKIPYTFILLLLLLTACGGGENSQIVQDEVYQAPAQVPEPDLEQAPDDEIMFSGRARADYLEDLDYLHYILRNNFPFFGVIYRRAGVDLDLLFEETRHRIATMDNIFDDLHFFNIVEGNIFRHVSPLGHLRIMDEDFAGWLLSLYGSSVAIGRNEVSPHVETFDNPATRAFYGFSDEDFIFEGVTEENLQWEYSNNIFTYILEEGRIAYVRIFSMLDFTINVDEAKLLAFYEEIADYEHLIVDIRGNGGGASWFFPNLVIAPNIDSPLNYNFYYFIQAHPHNLRFKEPRDWNLQPIHQDLVDRLAYINHEDLELLDMYHPVLRQIEPSHGEGIFGGKIWLLVDRWNFSASEYAAAIVKQTGFATLVGETTGGDGIGTDPSMVTLPNTGIAVWFSSVYGTDYLGRNNQEFGTHPHIFNREGMDALETVLAVIAEG